jgi:AraC-like DNA-binding protein
MLLRYAALLANTLSFELIEEGDYAQFVCTPLAPDPEAPQFEPEMVLTLACRAGRRFAISPSHGAAEVWFEHAAPAYAARCAQTFRCPVRFDRSRNAILLSRHCLDHAQPYADGALVEVLREHAERALAQLGAPNVPERVRALLSGADLRHIDARQIAQILKLHPRALRNQLGQANTSWSQLLDETRRGIACDELRRGEVQVRQLAERLGFTDPSAFSRAFKRWTGETPASYSRAKGGR